MHEISRETEAEFKVQSDSGIFRVMFGNELVTEYKSLIQARAFMDAIAMMTADHGNSELH